jgi:uncharacterized protein RhaS with RHS repeats
MMLQDGSATTRSYAGSTTQVQTAAANTEGSVTHAYLTDALGRMTQVNEDPSGVNFITGYRYTALDQLTKVTQGVQTRNFYYDSLRRLTKAVNVETGSVCYGTGTNRTGGYDGNNNLLMKTDARGFTATMTYDALTLNL